MTQGLNERTSASGQEDPAARDVLAAMQLHPRFPYAARASISRMVAVYEGNRLLNQLMNDRARVLFTHCALAQHFSRSEDDPTSGLTVSRMKSVCNQLQLCSSGRVEAMFAMLRISGYLAAANGDADRRLRRLVPTEKLIALHRRRWSDQFSAMSEVVDDAALSLAALDDERFFAAFAREMGRQYRRRRMIEGAPELAPFVEIKAGLVLLFTLMLADNADGAFSTERAVPVSVSALAKTFAVSRKHVLVLLREAEQHNLLRRIGDRGEEVMLQQKLVHAVNNVIVGAFWQLSQSARSGRHEVGLA
jgi:hypothetical protein